MVEQEELFVRRANEEVIIETKLDVGNCAVVGGEFGVVEPKGSVIVEDLEDRVWLFKGIHENQEAIVFAFHLKTLRTRRLFPREPEGMRDILDFSAAPGLTLATPFFARDVDEEQ